MYFKGSQIEFTVYQSTHLGFSSIQIAYGYLDAVYKDFPSFKWT